MVCLSKGTSKKYKCDFNRDTGWDELKAAGFDTVRAVAIDEDWTGLRFLEGGVYQEPGLIEGSWHKFPKIQKREPPTQLGPT